MGSKSNVQEDDFQEEGIENIDENDNEINEFPKFGNSLQV